MTNEPVHWVRSRDLPLLPDFRVGSLKVYPARRLVEGPLGATRLQPQVLAVFVSLAKHQDQVVTRETLFGSWGNATVGDDSLNRAVRQIRRFLDDVCAQDLSIETVPRTGYRLLATAKAAAGSEGPRSRAVDAAFSRWRAGLPKADIPEIDALTSLLLEKGGGPEDWGILALLLRKATEYSDAEDSERFVSRCEEAARQALSLNPKEGHALVALAGLPPLFGNWSAARKQLLDVLAIDEFHVPARHDLAVLEMATGRPSAAMPLISHLMEEDSLAATFHYKRMYHLWIKGDVNAAEQVAARGLQLWPLHPAIWNARFWILVFTGRAKQALRLVSDGENRPAMPTHVVDFLSETARLVQSHQRPEQASQRARHVHRCLQAAAMGPTQAVSSLLSLCALGAVDEAFDVARGYYLGDSSSAPPLRWHPGDPSITDQHRRVTQPLFIPATQRLREDKRFLRLCQEIGLATYWDEAGLTPDFLQP